MDAIKFLKEKKRMCALKVGCLNCPIGILNNKFGEPCRDFEKNHPEDAVAIIEKWSAEHPKKTPQKRGTGGQVNRMSDDLISRRALLEAIDSSFVTPILKINMREEHKAVSKIWEIIVNMPTAFDNEKVIEKLQRRSHNYYPSIDHYCLSRKAVDLKDAIEIVEKGGIE